MRESRSIPFCALAADAIQSRLHRSQVPDRETRSHASDSETPERLVELAQVRLLIEEAVRALPDKQRAVMALRDLELKNPADTCRTLGISQVYQRVLLHRARARVRAVLSEHLHRDETATADTLDVDPPQAQAA